MYFRKGITSLLHWFYNFSSYYNILIFTLTSDHNWIWTGTSSCVLELINKDFPLAHVANKHTFPFLHYTIVDFQASIMWYIPWCNAKPETLRETQFCKVYFKIKYNLMMSVLDRIRILTLFCHFGQTVPLIVAVRVSKS